VSFRDAFREFPILETERLVLRELQAEDAEAYHHQQATALAIPGRPPWGFGFEAKSAETARSSILFAGSAWRKKQRLKWGICLKRENGSLIGDCEMFDFANQSKAEIGYWLGAAYQRQGFMTEAVTAVVRYAFDVMGLHRIHAFTSTSNLSSVAMLEKVGFQQEGVLRQFTLRDGTWDDSAVLAILNGR